MQGSRPLAKVLSKLDRKFLTKQEAIIAGRKGRQRKGMISLGTAANDDRAYRTQTAFGPDNYSLIIAASTVDHLDREIIAGYSSFAIDFSRNQSRFKINKHKNECG